MFRDITKAPGPPRPGIVEEALAAFDASQRARRAAFEGFIGPRPRKARRPLASAAEAHLKAGGCGGDICRNCKGQGWQMEEYDHGKWTEARCYCCNGSGLRFNVVEAAQ